MKNKQEPTLDEMIARREEVAFHDFVEWFFKSYAPKDPYEASRFHADLLSLINRLYTIAQAPLLKQMSAALALTPLWPPAILSREPQQSEK
jgi:hypothetical protein